MKTLRDLKPGDEVVRLIGSEGEVKMPLKITAVTENEILCGPWTFDRNTGGEIDEDLGWDGYMTGSILRLP